MSLIGNDVPMNEPKKGSRILNQSDTHCTLVELSIGQENFSKEYYYKENIWRDSMLAGAKACYT